MSVATQLDLDNRESWFHSLDHDRQYRERRAQQRVWFHRKAKETVGDPDDFQPSLVAARRKYFDRDLERKAPRRGDPCQELPLGRDLEALGDSFVVKRERLAQAQELDSRHLFTKAKRLLFCGVIGRRVNCSGHDGHRFFQPYMCHSRYCDVCGPAWFRRKFSDAVSSLEPVADRLIHDGHRRGRVMVVAKLDFTVPNSGTMPKAAFVRRFHKDLRRFWRAAEREFGLVRYESIDGKRRRVAEYGVAGCDEFGGGNTNLHRHCVYVGPRLPQRKKELSALWSKIRREKSFVSIKRARSFRAALAHALKYPAKFLSASTPERLAELEATFHGTRRFSAGGVFYNVKEERKPGEDSPIGDCPLCGERLCEIVEPWVPRFVLEAEGRRSVEDVRREVGRAKMLSGPAPP